MLKDKEVEKIYTLIRLIDELYAKFFTGNLETDQVRRIKRYLNSRYKWFFDWMAEDPPNP